MALKEECGVFGYYSTEDRPNIAKQSTTGFSPSSSAVRKPAASP